LILAEDCVSKTWACRLCSADRSDAKHLLNNKLSLNILN